MHPQSQQQTPATTAAVKPSTIEALRSLDGTIAWGQPGMARSDFRSKSNDTNPNLSTLFFDINDE
jgi:hypothetical protein